MAIVQALSPTSDGHRRLGLASPATGEPVGEITVSTPGEVAAAIARARAAQPPECGVTSDGLSTTALPASSA